MSDDKKKYKVHYRSTPGMYAQYDGEVKVWATDETDAIEKAFKQLSQGAFSDRSRDMWKIEKVEKIKESK